MHRRGLKGFLNNKRGEEKIFSIWMFLIWGAVGLVIVLGINIFYGADTDIRQMEAEILYERIANCVIDNGFIDETLIRKDFNVFEECYLSEKLFNETSSFSFVIEVFDEDNNVLKDKIRIGTPFETECDLVIGDPREEQKPDLEIYPKCIRKTEYAYYYQENQDGFLEARKARIVILAVSNNQPGGVSL